MIQQLTHETVTSLLDPPAIAKILAICAELFPGEVAFEVGNDPSWPTETWPVVIVEATGTADEKVERTVHWHQRVADAIGSEHDIRLQIAHR